MPGEFGASIIFADNPARWTSKYGSLVTIINGMGTADGFNERGLAGHMLYLTATRLWDARRGQTWCAGGVMAAVCVGQHGDGDRGAAALETVQPVMVEAHGRKAAVHLALEDAGGDSVAIEPFVWTH